MRQSCFDGVPQRALLETVWRAPPKPPRCKPNEVPDAARVKLVPLIDELRGRVLPGAYSLGPALFEAIGMKSPGAGDMHMIRKLIYEVEWWQFYDLCEALVQMSGRPEEVGARIEEVFAEQNLPYAMTPEGIVWRFSAPAGEAVESASRLLLESDRFRGPAEQWGKALGHLARRPPDPENCVKDAVGAIEGLVRMVMGRTKDTLGELLPALSKQFGIHKALTDAIGKIYAYRGDQQAIAHGATGALSDLSAEAELVCHWCAASIVFVAKVTRRPRVHITGQTTMPSCVP